MKTRLFLLLLFISSISYSQIPTTSWYANYDFTNGVLTDVVNGATFTQTGTALTNVNDRFANTNNAVSLNGDYLTRSNVDYPNHVNFGSPYGQYGTVSFWIKTNTDDSNERIIIDDSNRSTIGSTTWTGYYIFLKDGKIGVSTRVRYAGSLGYQEATKIVTPYVSNGDWHHVAMTIGNTLSSTGASDILNTRAEIFIDGVNYGRAAIDHVRSIASGGLQLNESHDSTGNFKVGNNRTNNLPTANRYQDAIDDINIYRRQVTSAEVTQLATVNSFCFPPLPSIITVSNITETTADVSWAESGTFDLAYVIKGEPFTNATIISNINYTANTVQSITGLQPSKIYNVYLRKPCTASLNSGWSSPKEFRSNGIIYVNKNATGINNGTTWVDAFTDLQDALSVLIDNGKIWVAQGTYIPDASGRNTSFIIDKTNIELFGGFVGTETDLSQRDLNVNETILSGDLLANDSGNLTGTTRVDNVYHVIEINNNGTIIDGFTISDGYANGSGDNSVGGAIFKDKPVRTLTIKNSTIKNNFGFNAAGVFAEYTSSGVGALDIENSIFDNNLSRLCASFSAWARTSGTLTINISNSLFSNNETRDISGTGTGTGGSAGWLRAIGNSSTIVNANLINNTYVNNSDIGTHSSVNNLNRATVGASINYGGTLTLDVANNIFWNNTIVGGVVANSIADIGQTLGQVTVTNSIDQGSFSRLPSANLTNTSNADPLFTSTTDFTLQAGSPAINTGDNTKLLSNPTTDLIGNSRIFNTIVDMGVYEFGSTPPVDRTLTLNGTNGSITASPNPVNGTYAEGTIVTLTPNPDANYEFLNWGGDYAGASNTNTSPQITIIMDADKNITAYFGIIYYELSITANTQGTVTPSAPDRGSVDYISGSNVTLTATPNTGYEFDRWSGDVVGTANPISFTMDADKSVTPVYKPIKYTITIGNNYYGDNSTGSMTISPSSANNEYDYGTVVTFTATPAAGYEFEIFAFNGGAVATNPLNHTVTGDLTVNPGFTKIQRTLTIIETNGSITVNPNPNSTSNNTGTYDDGTVVTLTAIPDSGYQFDGWSDDATGTTNPLNVTMNADKTVTAIFSLIQRTLTINATNGSVTTNPNPVNGTYDDGTVITLTATPDSGYGFVNWSGDANGTTNVTTVTINSDLTIDANFSATASVKDANRINVSVYPNPVTNYLTVDLDEKIKIGKIIDATGKEIKRFNNNKINTNKISPGIYILKIETESGKIAMKKIIKK